MEQEEYDKYACMAIRCHKPATLAMILEVDSSEDSDFYHPPYSFLRKVQYCDDDFGFFYRSLSHSYTLVEVKVLVPFGVDTSSMFW